MSALRRTVDEVCWVRVFLLVTRRVRVARFRKIRMDEANVHHDALELPSGETVLLTRLCQGQHATVLQLPARPARAGEEEESRRRVASVDEGPA
jgi:hypothetical protein